MSIQGWSRKVLAGAVLAGCLGGLYQYAFAQSATTDDSKRRVKTKVVPKYPDLAKRMSVTGKVKIEAIVGPDGRVKSARALGGHPLLVQACQDAVQEWKFVAAPEESKQVIECDFAGEN